MFNIVLVEPEIPQNTGNIVRTAAATNCRVHIVKPIGFDISDKALKRAGLDYWHLTDFIVYESLHDFFNKVCPDMFVDYQDRQDELGWTINDNGRDDKPRFYFCSTKAHKRYDEIAYREGDYLLFGKETKGLSEELLRDNYNMTIRIPMASDARSLNLSNAVAIVAYEGMRQNNFETLLQFGNLTKF